MANHSCGKEKQSQPVTPPKRSGVSAFTEPEIRRWPHPVNGSEILPTRQPGSDRQTDVAGQTAALHYIYCALSYQNQLLADIKVMLEQMVSDVMQVNGEK